MQSHVSNTGTCLPLTSEDKLGVQNSPELSGTEACFSERTPQLSDEAVATTHSQSPSKFQGPTGSGIDEVFDDKDDTLSDIDDDEVIYCSFPFIWKKMFYLLFYNIVLSKLREGGLFV